MITAERLMLIGGIAAFLFTFYWVRSRRLGEKHAILWMLAAICMLIVGLFPRLLMWLAEASHLSYPTAVLFIALSVLYVFCMSVSTSLTRQHRLTIRLAEEYALVEIQLQQLQSQVESLSK